MIADDRIRYYLNLGDKELTDEDKVELQEILYELRDRYDEGYPLISDSDYDILQELLVYEGEVRSSSEKTDYGVRKQHPIDAMRGTLDKVYYLTDDEPRKNKSRKSLPEWIRSTQQLLDPYGINLMDEPVVVTAKYDGMSCCLYVDDNGDCLWLTRGNTDTNEGVDISHIMKYMNVEKVPNTATQFELLIENNRLEELNERYCTSYKNTRALTAGIVRTKEVDYRAQYIVPIPLKLYKNGKLDIHPKQYTQFPSIKCTLRDIDKIRIFANQNRNVMGKFRTDGAVITLMNPRVREILGRKNNINQWEVAYKFTEESAYATVTDVIFQVSDFGIVTPVLQIQPVRIKGNTITRISLHNRLRFESMQLRYGDQVKVLYDIIPYCIKDALCDQKNKTNRGSYIQFPVECPECGKPLVIDEVFAQCVNHDCPARRLGRLIIYLENLNCKGIGPKTLHILYNLGAITDIPSLYRVGSTKQMRIIMSAHGFGELRLRQILSEINRIRTLYDYEFFSAIGIRGLNKQFFRLVFSNYKMEDFIQDIDNKNWKKIQSIIEQYKGIGGTKAESLVVGLRHSRNLIQRTLKYITLKSSYGNSVEDVKGVVFTGFRDANLAKKLEQLGYQYQSNVNKHTVLVIAKDPTKNSGTTSTARERGIPIKSLEEVLQKGV